MPAVARGALLARRERVLAVYRRHGIEHPVVRCEELLAPPEDTLRATLGQLARAWDDRVLAQHRLHERGVTGATDAARPIDPANTDKCRSTLSEEEAAP
jgi:hypothetical protein